MTLDQYLTAKQVSTPDFARLVGMDPSAIWRIRNEKVRPDWKTIDAITAATNGEVMPNDFVPRSAGKSRSESAA